HGVTLRAMVGPAFGALLLVIGAWLIAKRQF
ncbi:EamA-like transporter family protein, partial [Salmonella enterica subsp. enterica serovar Enteritidis]|nr:EamA-like transporter family protein [Salmonella enterica]EIC0448687.1 EamA-like transporter family protein [Salmonella enterica subsp. enterica serovar Enteritidis]EKK6347417.1 EamA-like transporter family protein [Salmonella enterica]